jgi:hypothetical protein
MEISMDEIGRLEQSTGDFDSRPHSPWCCCDVAFSLRSDILPYPGVRPLPLEVTMPKYQRIRGVVCKTCVIVGAFAATFAILSLVEYLVLGYGVGLNLL